MIGRIEMADAHVSATLLVHLGEGLIRPSEPIPQTAHESYDRAILTGVNAYLNRMLGRQDRYAVDVMDTDDGKAWVLIEAPVGDMAAIAAALENQKS